MTKSFIIHFSILLGAVVATLATAALDEDKPSHRQFSKKLDKKFEGNPVYEKFARPAIHAVYHAGRYVVNGRNPEELARAKDQLSKVGTGQLRTDYLDAHRRAEAQRTRTRASSSLHRHNRPHNNFNGRNRLNGLGHMSRYTSSRMGRRHR